MIPAFLIDRYGPKLAALIFWGVIAVLAVLLLVGGYFAIQTFFTAGLETQHKVDTGQTAATHESGKDAVNTLGNEQANEQAADDLTRENANVIDHANGSDATVAPDARAAGLRALCSRASFRAAHPACVQ